jgi:hypothetical protein
MQMGIVDDNWIGLFGLLGGLLPLAGACVLWSGMSPAQRRFRVAGGPLGKRQRIGLALILAGVMLMAVSFVSRFFG